MPLSTIRRNRHLTDYVKVQKLMGFLLRNRRWWKVTAKSSYLNIGCGPNIYDGFTNLDYLWRPGIDICCDFTKGLPFKDCSFTGIFSEHALEHITYDQGRRLLRECWRVLKPGSTLRIIVPDAEMYVNAYKGIVSYPLPLSHLPTPMMKTAQIFQWHGHQAAYDYETLSYFLDAEGFTGIKRWSFQVGGLAALLIDSQERQPESLYVEAIKPELSAVV